MLMLDKHKIPNIIKIAIRFILPLVIVLVGFSSSISSVSSYTLPLNSNYSEISKKATAINANRSPAINSVFTFLESNKPATKQNLQESFEKTTNDFVGKMNGKQYVNQDFLIQSIKFILVDLSLVWNAVFWLLLLLVLYDSFHYSAGKNAFVNKLISTLFKVIRNTAVLALCLFGLVVLLYSILGQNIIFNRLYKSSELSEYFIWVILSLLQSLLSPAFYIVAVLFSMWLILFILRYFRVFENNDVQNVLINKFIHKRGYKEKPQTIRQKIMELRKVQQYNDKYNSNYNNFTKFSTNLPTNKDFAFDYLSIEESNHKSRLATIINVREGDNL
jgi:hypothetical protein